MSSTNPTHAARALLVGLALSLVAGACSAGSATPSPASPSTPSPAASAAAASASARAAASAGPSAVAAGSFHKVDGDASGDVALEHLADGSFAIVFENFKAAAKDHTNVILVRNVDVLKSADVDQSAILDLGPLKGTEGMQDYPVPAAMTANAMGYHTVVLWDTAMVHAVAAASLTEK